MSDTVRLDRWSTTRLDPYRAPEVEPLVLRGIATGHPRKLDGARIVTSRIVSVDGRRATTASGTTYELGEPDPEFLAWLRSIGRAFDPENPITVRP